MKSLKHSMGRKCTNRVSNSVSPVMVRQCETSTRAISGIELECVDPAALHLAGDCALCVHRKVGLIDPVKRLEYAWTGSYTTFTGCKRFSS